MSKNNNVGNLSLSTTVVTRFLLLCVVLLALPAVAAAQPTPLAVQNVWTQDAAGNNKTTFAPDETIQFVAELNNSYDGYLLAANGTQLTITTSFYNDTKPVDIPPGISTWPWTATAPSEQGNYTVTVRAYDHFYGGWVEGSASFTISQSPPPPPPLPPPQPPDQSPPHPGWYSNSEAGGMSSIISELNTGLRVTWANSYIYQHPGTVNLYWYAQVEYRNMGSQNLPINCVGLTDPSLFKEHIRGNEGLPPGASGYVPADETFCSRNPDFTGIIEPGEAHYDWAIFHNVPPGGEVSLEWGPFGLSAWVDPWYSAYPPDVPRPAECPPELVTLGTCQSKLPEGKARNLIVLVHGCCTDPHDV